MDNSDNREITNESDAADIYADDLSELYERQSRRYCRTLDCVSEEE